MACRKRSDTGVRRDEQALYKPEDQVDRRQGMLLPIRFRPCAIRHLNLFSAPRTWPEETPLPWPSTDRAVILPRVLPLIIEKRVSPR